MRVTCLVSPAREESRLAQTFRKWLNDLRPRYVQSDSMDGNVRLILQKCGHLARNYENIKEMARQSKVGWLSVVERRKLSKLDLDLVQRRKAFHTVTCPFEEADAKQGHRRIEDVHGPLQFKVPRAGQAHELETIHRVKLV